MRVTKVVVAATRKVPHPAQEFGSLSSLVSLEAEVSTEDDLGSLVPKLQAQVDEAVDSHLRRVTTQMLAQLRKDEAARRAKRETDEAAKRLAEKHGGGAF